MTTKAELVEKIAEISKLPKKNAESALSAFIAAVSESLAKGDEVALVGFGTFEVRDRAARKGHNPATGAPVDIPACKVPVFRAGKNLKEAVNVCKASKKTKTCKK